MTLFLKKKLLTVCCACIYTPKHFILFFPFYCISFLTKGTQSIQYNFILMENLFFCMLNTIQRYFDKINPSILQLYKIFVIQKLFKYCKMFAEYFKQTIILLICTNTLRCFSLKQVITNIIIKCYLHLALK